MNLVQSSSNDNYREQLSKLDIRSLPTVYQQALLEAQAKTENRADPM